MEYSYSLSLDTICVIGNISRCQRSAVWQNFLLDLLTKSNINTYRHRDIVEDQLLLWNARIDLDYSQLLFKSEADLTYFLLRFS